jgi:cbb3-type cytochrome c oxidase subunit III
MILARDEGHRRPMTRSINLHLALRAATVAIVVSVAAHVDAADAAGVSQHDLKAKLDYCEVCHGIDARGFVGYYPVPRLAGQQVEYVENQLKGFVERKRENTASPEKTNVMFNVGHVLSPEMIKALATNFHELNPKPVGGAPKELVASGQKIFEGGVPSAKVPACASCHGDHAEGNGPIPRLAGQLYPYVVTQLTNWAKERAETNSNIMAPIAHGLTESQIHAVAAYVSYLQ